MDIVIGIDFGTTNSCLSYYNKNTKNVTIIPNEQGNFTIPSILFLNQDSSEILFGDAALQLLYSNNYVSNILYNLKRLIGANNLNQFNNKINCFQHNNFQIENNEIVFNVIYDNTQKQFSIKSLIILYLNYLKNLIKNYFSVDKDSFDIVITVPAYFNDFQRIFIKECCETIGFNVLNIINEPTAASLAYALDKFKKGKINEEYILTFDCGGGTTDISLLHLDYIDAIYEVKNTVGDNFLGGEDITNNLTNYIIHKLNIDINNISNKTLNKIKSQSEIIKKQLSFKESVTCFLELGEKDYSFTITQTQFNELNHDFYRKIQNLIYYVLDDYIQKTRDFNYSKINSIIFVGGTSRIPYFKKLFNQLFPNAYINNYIDPDQTISIGASIKGALLKNFIDEDSGGDTLLMDIVPLSIGIETFGGIMTPIISRNSMIPISRSQQFTNCDAYEKTIIINIYQGERKFVKDNIFLTSFELSSDIFQKYDKGEINITVTFNIDIDSIIHAKAIAKLNDSNIISEIQVTKEHKQSLTNQKLEEILYYSEINKLKDNELSNQLLAKLQLYDSFKYLLSVYHEKCIQSNESSESNKLSELNELFNNTFNIIQNYLEYSSKELYEIKDLFEKKWHNIIFDQKIVLKDEYGQIIEFGGTKI